MTYDKPRIYCANDGTFWGHVVGTRIKGNADPGVVHHRFATGDCSSIWRCFNSIRNAIGYESYAWLADFDHTWPISREVIDWPRMQA